jgi:hypothetical protein
MTIRRSPQNRMITPSSLEHAEAFDRDGTFERNEDPALPPYVSRDEGTEGEAVVEEEET